MHGVRISGGKAEWYRSRFVRDDEVARARGLDPLPGPRQLGGGAQYVADNIVNTHTFAQAGMQVTNTSTPGFVYEISSEHHVRNEVVLDHASNWQIYALQTEEEWGEGGFALPLDIRDSTNITLANLFIYRVVGSYQPFRTAVEVSNSTNIRFRNLHCYSDSKVSFDSAIYDETNKIKVRQRELSWLTMTTTSGDVPVISAKQHFTVPPTQATVEKLASGFFNISGGAVDAKGDVYFIDPHRQTIYRWSVATRQLSIVRDDPEALLQEEQHL